MNHSLNGFGNVQTNKFHISPAVHFRDRLLRDELVMDLRRRCTDIPGILTADPGFMDATRLLVSEINHLNMRGGVVDRKRTLNVLFMGGSGSGKTYMSERLALAFNNDNGGARDVPLILNFNQLTSAKATDGQRISDMAQQVLDHIANPMIFATVLDEVHGLAAYGAAVQTLLLQTLESSQLAKKRGLKPHLLLATSSKSDRHLGRGNKSSVPDFYTRFRPMKVPQMSERSLDAAVLAADTLVARGRFSVSLNALVALVDRAPSDAREVSRLVETLLPELDAEGFADPSKLQRLGLATSHGARPDRIVRIIPAAGVQSGAR